MLQESHLDVPFPASLETSAWDSSEVESGYQAVPFSAGPPTTGFAPAYSGLKLLHRFAFPCYHYASFISSRRSLEAPYHVTIGGQPIPRAAMWFPGRNAVDVTDYGGRGFNGGVKLFAPGEPCSPVPEEAFYPSQRDKLGWSSDVLRVRAPPPSPLAVMVLYLPPSRRSPSPQQIGRLPSRRFAGSRRCWGRRRRLQQTLRLSLR